MTEAQRRKLGELLAGTRERRGLSVRQLAAITELSTMWLSDLERGLYADPAPARLARVAEALDIEPSRIDRITRGSVASGLPGMRTYFRAKTDLSPEQITQVERYIQRLQKDAP